MYSKSVAGLALLLFVVQVAASSKELIDAESLDVIAGSELCKNSNKRISRISSIGKLLEQIEASRDAECQDLWLDPLKDLKVILDLSAKDACSLETISKIEEFHWDYVVGALSKSWRKASIGPIPEALKMFFLHFAEETVETCKSYAGQRLEMAAGKAGASPSSITKNHVGFTLDVVSYAMVPQGKVKKFEDFFFIINSIISMEKKKGKAGPEGTLDPKTGETTYGSLKVRDATIPFATQEKCRQEMRPVYSNTILPVMKLIDLGFGIKGEGFHSKSKLIAEWYSITQFCQLVLPVKFYSSKTMNDNQISVVSKEEAKTLESPESAVVLPPNVEVQPINLDDVLEAANDDHVAKRVKASFKSRAKLYRKTFKHAIGTVKHEITSRIKSIFVSKKKGNQFIMEKDESITKSLDEVENMVRQEEMEDRTAEEVDESTGLVRQKRSKSKERREPSTGIGGPLGFIAGVLIVAFFTFCILLMTHTIHLG